MLNILEDREYTQVIEDSKGEHLLYFKAADIYLGKDEDGLAVFADAGKLDRIQGSHPGFISIPVGSLSMYERMLRALSNDEYKRDTASFVFYFVYHALRNFVNINQDVLHEIGEWDPTFAHMDELLARVRMYPSWEDLQAAHPHDVLDSQKYVWSYCKAVPISKTEKELQPTFTLTVQPKYLILMCERGVYEIPLYKQMLSSELYLLGAAQMLLYRIGMGSVHQRTWFVCDRWQANGPSEIVYIHDSTRRTRLDKFLTSVSRGFIQV